MFHVNNIDIWCEIMFDLTQKQTFFSVYDNPKIEQIITKYFFLNTPTEKRTNTFCNLRLDFASQFCKR